MKQPTRDRVDSALECERRKVAAQRIVIVKLTALLDRALDALSDKHGALKQEIRYELKSEGKA